MDCSHCHQELHKALTEGKLKSCPHCSENQGEHIYYKLEAFGLSEKRVNRNDAQGKQSWCILCRKRSTEPRTGWRCSRLDNVTYIEWKRTD
jgi:hypothetical protein